jgi:hypothetical protein
MMLEVIKVYGFFFHIFACPSGEVALIHYVLDQVSVLRVISVDLLLYHEVQDQDHISPSVLLPLG